MAREYLCGREVFSSAGNREREEGRAASASTVSPLTAATEVPSAPESSDAASPSACKPQPTMRAFCAGQRSVMLYCVVRTCLILVPLLSLIGGISSNREQCLWWNHCLFRAVSIDCALSHLPMAIDQWQLLQALGKSCLETVQRSTAALCSRL